MIVVAGAPDGPRTVGAVIAIGAFLPLVLLVAPVLVGALVNGRGYTPAQAGYVISAELAGMALATFPALALMPRVDWRVLMRIALVGLVAGNTLSMAAPGPGSLMALRFLTAVAGGLAIVLTMAVIAAGRDPDSRFGWWLTAQFIVGALCLWLLPDLLRERGPSLFFGGMAGAFALLLPLSGGLPPGVTVQRPAAALMTPGAWLGLAALFLFEAGVGGVWTYVERIAAAANLIGADTGRALAVASLLGIAGAACAGALGLRHGRAGPLRSGIVLLLAAMAALLFKQDPVRYLLAVCALKFGWTFVFPYLMGCMATLDPGGRSIIIANAVLGGGLAAGPALAATLLGTPPDYDVPVLLGLATVALSGGLALVLVGRSGRDSSLARSAER